MPPRFFITHSWKDIGFARRLCDDLTAHGLDGFLDAHSINPGDSIPSRIERGLKECDVYIPVFSPDALKSDWCDWEIDMAITMNRTRKGRPRIIPVIAKPCDVPDRLMHLLYISFVGRYDDALEELLTKGFNLPVRRTAPPAPNGHPIALPLGTGRSIDALAMVGLIVTLCACIGTYLNLPQVRAVLNPPMPDPSLTPILGIGSTKTAKDGSLMMFVPAGEFLMGSSDADKNAYADEKPQHTVYLDAFWIAKYDVTNALYKKCVDAGLCSIPAFWTYGAIPAGKENHPVVGVSWNDAVGYAQWVGGRLPTEAEWEKAACWDDVKKAKRVYPWGDVFDPQKANTYESKIGDTTPVGKYSPQGDSSYGVSDMAGNVWGWVADGYSGTYYPNSPKNNPKGADSGQARVFRGGSWADDDVHARCAYRNHVDPGNRYGSVGFRVAESFP